MELTDLFVNGVSVVGIVSAIGMLLVLCVPKLRNVFAEYILLKHDNEEYAKKLEEYDATIKQLTERISELEQQVQ